MKKAPKYMTPGSRSAIEGSGVTGGVPQGVVGGELTPPGLVSHPRGAANVAYSAGASTPATAAFETSTVQMTDLTYPGK